MNARRVVFSGSREFPEWAATAVRDVLFGYPTDVIIVHGAARGLDSIVDREAREMGFRVEAYPAEWMRTRPNGTRYRDYGAGHKRNRLMAGLPNVERLEAFLIDWAPCKGTRGMIREAQGRIPQTLTRTLNEMGELRFVEDLCYL